MSILIEYGYDTASLSAQERECLSSALNEWRWALSWRVYPGAENYQVRAEFREWLEAEHAQYLS